MQNVSDLAHYLAAFFSYWWLWPAEGCGIFGLVYFWERRSGRAMEWKYYKAMLIVGAVVSFYQVWHEDHMTLLANEGKIRQWEVEKSRIIVALAAKDRPIVIGTPSQDSVFKKSDFTVEIGTDTRGFFASVENYSKSKRTISEYQVTVTAPSCKVGPRDAFRDPDFRPHSNPESATITIGPPHNAINPGSGINFGFNVDCGTVTKNVDMETTLSIRDTPPFAYKTRRVLVYKTL